MALVLYIVRETPSFSSNMPAKIDFGERKDEIKEAAEKYCDACCCGTLGYVSVNGDLTAGNEKKLRGVEQKAGYIRTPDTVDSI